MLVNPMIARCLALLVVVTLAGCAGDGDDGDDAAEGEGEAVGVGRLDVQDEDGSSLCIYDACLVDFGGVGAGQAATRTVQLVNVGDGELLLERVVFADGTSPGFAVDGPVPTGLTVGGSAPLSLSVRPTVVGVAQGILVVDDVDVTLRVNVMPARGCQPTASPAVATVNGVAVAGEPVLHPFDDVVLSTAARTCSPDVEISSFSIRLISAPANADISLIAGGRFMPTAPGTYRFGFIVVDDLGAASDEAILTLEVVDARSNIDIELTWVGGDADSRGQLHVAPANAEWCAGDDCFDATCQAAWAPEFVTGAVVRASARLPDGTWQIGAAVDGGDRVFVRVFSEGRLIGEFVSDLTDDELLRFNITVVDGAVDTVADSFATAARTGDCW